MSKVIVSNWKQVYKSLAVWFPIIASGIYVLLQDSTAAGVIPEKYLPIVIGLTGILGWVIPQKSIKKKG